MELNFDLIDRALEYRAESLAQETLVRALWRQKQAGFVDIPTERATRSHLFDVLVAVEGDLDGVLMVKLPDFQSDTKWLYAIWRFGFECGYLPVFRAKTRHADGVYVPTENDGVLMTAYVDTLLQQFLATKSNDDAEEFGRRLNAGMKMGGSGGFTIF